MLTVKIIFKLFNNLFLRVSVMESCVFQKVAAAAAKNGIKIYTQWWILLLATTFGQLPRSA